MMTNKPVLFLAPGAGLGHCVRAAALCLELRKNRTPCVIVTTSRWAEALARLTGIAFFHIPPHRWACDIRACIDSFNAGLVVQDTFPFGFRGEDLESTAKKIPFVYIARHLNIGCYLKSLNRAWNRASALVSTTIAIEPLSKEHWNLIEGSGQLFTLGGRIRFPFHALNIPVPERLDHLLSSDRLHLVVHSGPEHETRELTMLAEKALREEGQGNLAVINPAMAANGQNNAFDYFPAAALYHRAYRFYTGGGYNAVAEGELFPGKQVVLPFNRTYDDQKARIDAWERNPEAGSAQAAQLILSIAL